MLASLCRTFRKALRELSLVGVALVIPTVLVADEIKRPMQIHRIDALGLEIWTEYEPRWETRLEQGVSRPTFTAETPASTYPPAGFTWTTSGLTFSGVEFPEAARGAVMQAALNYRVPTDIARELNPVPARYGELEGYEAQFAAIAEGVPIDVKVFFGHTPGMPAVAMHAVTLRHKLPHVSDQIQRSWTNTRYLAREAKKK